MRTFDRTQGFQEHIAPGTRRNYLGETLASFAAGGAFVSPLLRAFHVVDSGSHDPGFLTREIGDYPVTIHRTDTPRTPNENAGEALRVGAEAAHDGDWVLFCEDDIAVCARFIESVDAWLAANAREDRRLYTFGSAHAESGDGLPEQSDISITSFFGTTCYAMRKADAESMAAYIQRNPLYNGGRFYGKGGVPVAHDLHYHQWSSLMYPALEYFSVSVPSFVQHIGDDSGISTRAHLIQYKSWRGPGWSYI